MDPITALGLGASIVSFIDVGLKATKKIHSLLSGIKDGPQYVEQTSRNVYDLLSALEQISKCPMIDENNDKTLTVRLLACLNDLQMFDRELQQLSIDDSERRLGKYWKKVKTVWNEKALARMGSVISGHTAALNLHLNILHRYMCSYLAENYEAFVIIVNTNSATPCIAFHLSFRPSLSRSLLSKLQAQLIWEP